MRDYELIQLFRPIVIEGLIDAGFIDVLVASSYQPKQEGAEIPNTIYFYKISDSLLGWPLDVNRYDSFTNSMIKYQEQWYETVFQISALVNVNPANVNGYTASDLVRATSFIFQKSKTITTLFDNQIGIYKISEIRNPFLTNEYGRYQASPSFDITFTHKTINNSVTEVIESAQAGIYRI